MKTAKEILASFCLEGKITQEHAKEIEQILSLTLEKVYRKGKIAGLEIAGKILRDDLENSTPAPLASEDLQFNSKGTIEGIIGSYKTKHQGGFTCKEIEQLLKKFPGIDRQKFDDALCGITCTMKNEETIIYHCDVEKALRCGIEKRGLTSAEMD